MIANLPLFPLQAVLFPGGLLNLKVFEARYLDLVGRCLRQGTGFGIVCLRGDAPPRSDPSHFEPQGVLTRLDEVDAEQAGILHVRCVGTERFTFEPPRRQADGLWLTDAHALPEDDAVPPSPALLPTVKALSSAIATLREQGTMPFLEPFRLADAGWVANRWCEILPISLAAKQKLMQLDDPLIRLQLVDEFLRNKGVVRD
jgi:Lon protease-like protein